MVGLLGYVHKYEYNLGSKICYLGDRLVMGMKEKEM